MIECFCKQPAVKRCNPVCARLYRCSLISEQSKHFCATLAERPPIYSVSELCQNCFLFFSIICYSTALWAAPGKQICWVSHQWTQRFISAEKVDKIAKATFRCLRLLRLGTSSMVKPDTINSWVGNSQQIMVLIKFTLFLASDKSLKLLEVLYLVMVITNWALCAEDHCKYW